MIEYRLRALPRLLHILVAAFIFTALPARAAPSFSLQNQPVAKQRVRTEIPYRDGMLVVVSDTQERITKTLYRATGNVEISYKNMVLTCDVATYDEESQEAIAQGKVKFSQNLEWLVCTRAEFNFQTQKGVFYDASGYTDRQFYISGRTIRKTGPDTYRADNSKATTCDVKHPKWSFSTSRTTVYVDHTARMRNMVFKVKGIPVFYTPYLIFPMEKKERSSGFLPFRTGNSNSKGRVFSEGYYQTLGQSADLTIIGDYFSERGLALGSTFRIMPNPVTRLNLDVYGLNDRLGQGGVQLQVDGESWLKDNWRVVSKVNITSNFQFRQVFADSFRAATVSQERAIAFLTQNQGSISTNIAYQRDEVWFPIHSLVTRKVPSIEFLSLGTPIAHTPFIFGFRTSVDGISRIDSTMETPRLVQRLDIYPRLTLRLPGFAGVSIIPSAGVRETYYGARLSDDAESGVLSQNLQRRYADLNVELRLPAAEKDFSSPFFGNFKHVVEPYITYTWIHGIDNLRETIRFDYEDAIADTNDVEYGIINRFYRSRRTGSGSRENYEFMSLSIVQKYYFDPLFGGAFLPGELNSFRPMDTVTGFYQTGLVKNSSPVSMVFRLIPENTTHYEVRLDYDTRLHRLRNLSASTHWRQGKFELSGTYFNGHALEPEMLPGDHIQGNLGYGSTLRGFSASTTVSYNIRASKLLNSQTKINYNWDCCGVTVEYTQYGLGLRTESRFSFAFTLKGIGSFGNVKHPENLF